MADIQWPNDLVPYSVAFYLQPHVGGTESPFSRTTKHYGLSAPRWICRMAFRAPASADDWSGSVEEWGERLDAMIARLEGGLNRVILYDFRRPGEAPAFSNGAVSAGDESMTFAGAAPGDIRIGEYVGGDGRPHIITRLSKSGDNMIATVKPPFVDDIAAGAAAFQNVTGAFRLVGEDAGANQSTVGELTEYVLEFVEDIEGAEIPEGLSIDPEQGAWAVTPTGEIVTYDEEKGWLREDGKPYATVIARFDGPAGQGVDSAYHIDHFHAARDFETAMGFQRLQNSVFFTLDGAGAASSNSSVGSGAPIVNGAQLIPAGASDWEGYIDVIPGTDTNGNPRLYRTDGNISSGLDLDINTGALRVFDHIGGAPSTAGYVRQSKPLPGFVATEGRRLHIRFKGAEVTATDIATGTEVKAISALGEALGGKAGIASRRLVAQFQEMVVHPRDYKGFTQIGAMRFLGPRGLVHCPDCDLFNGLDYSDHALISWGTSQNSTTGFPQSQGPANVMLGRIQRSTGEFAILSTIDTNSSQSVSDRITKNEGCCLFEINGVVHVATADQGAHRVMLYRAADPDDLTVGSWPRVKLNTQDTFNIQTVMPLDVGDGEIRLACIYEGSAAMSGMNLGGIILLKYNGSGDTLNLANWTEIPWVECPGAWGTPKADNGVLEPVDLLGNGQRRFVFGSRKNFRNVNGLGGVYNVDIDEGGSVDAPNKTLLTIRGAAEDTVMIDFVDLGSGHGLDIAYTETSSGNLNLLTNPRGGGAWAKDTHAMPVTSDPYPWNVWNSGHLRNGRTVMLVVMGEAANGGLYGVSWTGSAWEHTILQRMPVGHPFDKSVLFRFALDNGLYYWLGGDSGGHHARGFLFFEESATVPTSPSIVLPTLAETNALAAAMTTAPTDERKAIINKLISRLKSSGAWEYIDVLYLLAAADAQAARLNWKNPGTLTASAVSSPAFVADKGYTSNGTSSYLNTGYNPSTSSLGYDLNDAHIGIVSRTDTGTSGGPDIGSANDMIGLVTRNPSTATFKLNRASAVGVGAGTYQTPVPFHLMATRRAATDTRIYANGRLANTNASAPTSVPDTIWIGRGGSLYSPRQLAAAHAGRAFPTDKMAQEVSLAIMEYVSAVGALNAV